MNKNNIKYFFCCISLAALVFLFTLNTSYSQVNYINNDAWKWVHPSPQGNVLRWCKMWDANNWYMVGNGGTFMKTTDGGSSWTINSHAGVLAYGYTDVQSAHFFNPSNGILACAYGLTRTTDGGNTFTLIAGTAVNVTWKALHFLDNNSGFVCGGFGLGTSKFAKTTDGGNTWIMSNNVTSGSYNDVYTPDGNLLLLAGADGIIQRSTDGGISWSSIPSGSSEQLNRFNFINRDTGFVSGRSGYFAYTSNGGSNWEIRNTGLPFSPFYDIDFKTTGSIQYIYLTGNKDYIYSSSNYGISWDTVGFKEPIQNSTDIAYLYTELGGGDTLLTVGTFGLINKKTAPNVYYSYTNAARYGQAVVYGVGAVNGNVWAVGQPTTTTSYNQIMFSSNAGESWSVQTTPVIGEKIMTSIQMLNSLTGLVTGTIGTVLKTTNGGSNWNLMSFPSNNNLRNLKFMDLNTGWVFGNAGTICKTTDGGDNWSQQTVTGLNGDIKSMSMINQNTGWIVAGNNFHGFLFKTVDGGENWSEQTPGSIPEIFDIQMFNENTGYMCGNQILQKTTNGGVNWENMNNPFPAFQWMSLKFFGPLVGFVATFASTIKTTDGGLSWETSLIPNSIANTPISNGRIYALSSDTVYAPGFWSGVMKYTTPGPIGVVEWQNEIPGDFKLYQNYPNPFNPFTTIKFEIPKAGNVSLKVYDITGREVKTIINDMNFNRGIITYHFDSTNLASGIYFYSLIIDGDMIDTKKMILVK